MRFDFTPDFVVDDANCTAQTGKGFAHWFERIRSEGLGSKRRDAIQLIYNDTGRGKDMWWPTTIWVEFERSQGIVQKDGRPEGYNICCTKGFKQTPDELWPHFSSEAAVKAWTGDWSGGLQEGAKFACGGCAGTVGRMRPGKDLRLAWHSPGFGPTDVDIQFMVMGGKTTVNIFHKRIGTRAESDGLRRGWGEALDRLKAIAA